MDLQEKINLVPKILEDFDKVIFGQKRVKDEIIKGFLSNEHVLIEALPGLGKTELIKSLAVSSGLDYKRIQGTPDLMPQDILGYTSLSGVKVEGPIMTNILLVDEINRINPKTLSALLSAMSERIVIDVDSGKGVSLPSTFIVIATQNPSEVIGTFEMPEATKDRFGIKIQMKKEPNILLEARKLNDDDIPCDVSNNLLNTINKIFDDLEPELSHLEFIKTDVKYGPSIRAGLQFIKMCKVTAFIKGRDFVIMEDLKDNIVGVFSDKIVLNEDVEFSGKTKTMVLKELIRSMKEFD